MPGRGRSRNASCANGRGRQRRELLLLEPQRLDVLQQRQWLVDVHRSERLRSQVFLQVELRATVLAREFALVILIVLALMPLCAGE